MTKIHYGILLSIPFIVMTWSSLWKTSPIPHKAELHNFFKKLFSHPYVYLTLAICAFYSLLILLQLSGKKELSILGWNWNLESYQTTTWPIFFAPLLIWTVEWLRGNNFIITKLSPEGHRLHLWVFFPFAWYYLVPGFQKVCFLIGNLKASRGENLPSTDWLQALFHDYLALPGEYTKFIMIGFAILFTIYALLNIRKSNFFKAALYLGIQFFFYFLFIAIINQYPMPRLVSLWAAQLLVMCLWATLPLFNSTNIFISIIAITITVFAGVRFEQNLSQAEITNNIAQEYLPENFLESETIFQCLDPTKPGILYGLEYHLAAPIFTVWVKQNDPNASLLFKHNYFLASDLGWGWKHSPQWEQLVLEKFRTGKYEQFVFFNIAISGSDQERISKTIIEESNGKIKLLLKNKYYVLLANPDILKPECALTK